MRIAIPSYKRPQTLCKKTLRYLERAGVPIEMINVFVASEEERVEYNNSFSDNYRPAIVVGVPGIHRQRAYIESYYAPGTHLVSMDDDVSSLKMLRPLPLLEFFQRCFELADQEHCGLWGLSASSHTLSLKDEAVIGLRYCIGACFGFITGRVLEYPDPFTEDYTRSVEYYKRGWGLIRFNGVGINTRYFKEPGGLQSCNRTPEEQRAQMERLVERFPDLVRIRIREGKPVDARLVLKTERRIEQPFF